MIIKLSLFLTVQERLVPVCAQMVSICLYLARSGRQDLNMLAISVTKWNKGCDKRLPRLISDIDHLIHYTPYCCEEDKLEDCKLWLFKDASFARYVQDSNQLQSECFLCLDHKHSIDFMGVQEANRSFSQPCRV